MNLSITYNNEDVSYTTTLSNLPNEFVVDLSWNFTSGKSDKPEKVFQSLDYLEYLILPITNIIKKLECDFCTDDVISELIDLGVIKENTILHDGFYNFINDVIAKEKKIYENFIVRFNNTNNAAFIYNKTIKNDNIKKDTEFDDTKAFAELKKLDSDNILSKLTLNRDDIVTFDCIMNTILSFITTNKEFSAYDVTKKVREQFMVSHEKVKIVVNGFIDLLSTDDEDEFFDFIFEIEKRYNVNLEYSRIERDYNGKYFVFIPINSR